MRPANKIRPARCAREVGSAHRGNGPTFRSEGESMQIHMSRSVRRWAVGGLVAVCACAAASPAVAEEAPPITPDDVTVAPAETASLAAATGLPIPASAVPTPPGPPWAFSVGVNTSGITVRATSGYARLTGLIRWNRSYSFGVSLTDYPFKGGRLSAGGNLTGDDIFQPIPISGLGGYLTGPIEIAPNIAILGGAVDWTSKGFAFSGGLRFLCTTGSLDATAEALIVNEDNFELSALGQASACTLGRAGRLDGRTFWADVSSNGGKVALDAGVSIGRLDLFTAPLGRSKVSTYLQNVGGSITSPDGRSLTLAFRGTGGADMRTSGLPTVRLKATVSGAFGIRGTQLTKISVALSGVSVNGTTFLPTLGLTTRLVNDTTTAFTTP